MIAICFVQGQCGMMRPMNKERFSLDPFSQCRGYGVPLWQCPQFLFLIMGCIIIASSILSFVLGRQYIVDPHIVIFLVLALTAILLIIAFVITHSFEKLAQANRLKSEFISIVSHQLRSPISNLQWTLDYLMSGRAGSIKGEQTEYFRILKDNSARMQQLVNDLLVVSRIQQGTFALRNQDIQFSNLVDSLVAEFLPFARASNVELIAEKQDPSVFVFQDPTHVRGIVSNLIDNAIRYSKKQEEKTEKSRVVIRYHMQGSSLWVEVEDSGVGIPTQDQKYIFQKFFRSDNALKHQTRGSGLGLYIAKSIAEKMGGSIGFRSAQNKGSIFWFLLPNARKKV